MKTDCAERHRRWEKWVMKLRRYCVTVMDKGIGVRRFWTLRGARKWRDSFPSRTAHVHLFVWDGHRWQETR